MTLQHLPRPWMLAALADVPVSLLARHAVEDEAPEWEENAPPRPEERRQRLSARYGRQRCHGWYDEDAWGGVEPWRDVEVDRAA